MGRAAAGEYRGRTAARARTGTRTGTNTAGTAIKVIYVEIVPGWGEEESQRGFDEYG